MAYTDLNQREYIIDGVSGIGFVQQKDIEDDQVVLQVNGKPVIVKPDNSELIQTSNPVENPPFNNWSVNQPSPPHARGAVGNEDLGWRNIVIDGVNGYDFVQTESQNPVENPPFNNWSVNQPSPPHARGAVGNEDLGWRNLVIDGVNGYDLTQTRSDVENPVENPPLNNWSVNQPSPPHAQGMAGKESLGLDIVVRGHPISVAQTGNPVENPPFNNWSVNQPSPPHDRGMAGKEDLGMKMVVNGTPVQIAQQENPVENPPFNNWSVHQPSPPHDRGMAGNEDLGMNMVVNGTPVHIAQRQASAPVNTITGMKGDEDLGMDMRVGGTNVHVAQKHRQ